MSSKIRYGLVFPEETTDLSIELHCYRWGIDPTQKAFHLKNAWQIAFPEKLHDGRRGYIWSEWDDRAIEGWCRNRYQTWWGPSASGKTTRAAIICLLHWLSAPDLTTIHLTSTTAKMLKRRIWGEITKYYLLYGEGIFPGQLKIAENAIVFSEANIKAGIFGHAVKGGTLEDAVSNIIGIHNEFNVLIIDEMQGTPVAIAKADANLSIGREFKFLGMGNPMSRLDLLGEWSEPVSGWGSISPEMESWETKRGVCLYFDGLKSPGVLDPEKYPFFLKQNEIDETRRIDGEDSPTWWTMRRGFVPPDGLMPTMITEGQLVEGKVFNRDVVWGERLPRVGMGVDPAYSSGGDRCMCYPFKFGPDVNGVNRLEWMTPRQINLKLAADVPMLTFLKSEIIRVMTDVGVTCDTMSMDCSGMQGMLADAIEEEMDGKILRVFFGGPALDEFTVSHLDRRTGKQAYKNRGTQLMGHFSQYVKSGIMRNLDKETSVELCLRQLTDKVYPIKIEAKDEYKSRYGASPDRADSAIVATALIRERWFILPDGQVGIARRRVRDIGANDPDGWEDNYLTEG